MDVSVSNASLGGTGSLWDQISSQNLNPPSASSSTAMQEDSVSISNFSQRAMVLKDEEVEAVLQETVNSITNDPYSALHVHSGLDASRVAALLA